MGCVLCSPMYRYAAPRAKAGLQGISIPRQTHPLIPTNPDLGLPFFAFLCYNIKAVVILFVYHGFIWRRIEVVITGRTRNAFALRGTRVRIPPSPSHFHRKTLITGFSDFSLFCHSFPCPPLRRYPFISTFSPSDHTVSAPFCWVEYTLHPISSSRSTVS